MNSERGRVIHGQAEHAREAGEFTKALQLTDEATVIYAEDKDSQGLSEVQSSRLLTFRHLHQKTGDRSFLILAEYAARAGVALAEESNNKEALSMPYFNLGKAFEDLQKFPDAIDAYRKAIDTKVSHPGALHNRTGVMADMKGHLAIAEYKNGDKLGVTRAEVALKELLSSDEPTYNKDVWSSGAYMRMAEAIIADNKDAAHTYLEVAQKIIDANPELILRKLQIDTLRKKLAI